MEIDNYGDLVKILMAKGTTEFSYRGINKIRMFVTIEYDRHFKRYVNLRTGANSRTKREAILEVGAMMKANGFKCSQDEKLSIVSSEGKDLDLSEGAENPLGI